MNRLELITILRGLIREELRDSNFIKSIIREEVKKETNRLLTEMEEKQVDETSLVEMASNIPIGSKEKLDGLKHKMENRKKIVSEKEEPVIFVKNRKLNMLLNETLMDLRTGKAIMPASDIPGTDAEQWPAMQYNKDPRSFAHAKALNLPPGAEKPVEAMIPSVDVEGRPMAVNADALPEHIKNALTRNYKPLMRVINKKDGK